MIKNHRIIGICGYDPILGCFSPDLRIMIHCISIIILWFIVLLFTITFIIPDDITFKSNCIHSIIHIPNTFLIVGSVVMSSYLLWFYYLYNIASGVSVIGPPRKHKIQRKPQWNNVVIPIPSNILNNNNAKYRLSIGNESYRITEKLFLGTSASITGETSGRDIWTNHEPIITSTTNSTSKNNNSTTSKNSNSIKIDDKLIKEMASGGRSYTGFNPSINPNRYVK